MSEPVAECDVLVLGAGASGMTAALAAEAEGMRTVLVEASAQVGGTSATSAGTLWLPAADGGTEARGQAMDYLRAAIGPDIDERMMSAFIDATGPLLDFLSRSTAVRLSPVAVHPDYLQQLPGASLGGRAYAPAEFDGRLLGDAFALVRAPIPEFMVLGGMMVSKADIPVLLNALREPASLVRAARLLLRHLLDRIGHRRGTRLVMGNALVAQLFHSIIRSTVELRLQTQLRDVEREGAVWCCSLESAGKRSELRVRRGLVLATGGFSGDAEARQKWLPELARDHSIAFEGNGGGGVRLGQRLGGAIQVDHAPPAFWMPVSTRRRADGSLARFPHIMLDRAKPGLLAIDGSGRRFVNEADSYHHFCEGMLRAQRERGARRFFLVADREFVREYGLGMIHPGRRSTAGFEREGYLASGPTPQALAVRLGVDAATLASTLRAYNEDAARGVDSEYGRGASPLNRHNGDPRRAPNPCLRPLDLAHLVAVEVFVADLATSVGLNVDSDARVLDAQGAPIEGLYACGNDMASIMRGAYPGPGTTLGPGMVFAWRAARHLAAGVLHGTE